MLQLTTAYEFSIEQHRKIQCLRDKIKDCNELDVGSEDTFMSKFLFFTNWDVDKAFQSVRRYYDFKARYLDLLAHHTVEFFHEELRDIKAKFIMPMPDKMGRPIAIFKVVDYFSKYPNYITDQTEMDDLIFESLVMIPQVQERGITIIIDLRGFTRNSLSMLSPRIYRFIKEKSLNYPFSKGCIHIIQRRFLMNATSSIIMSLLSQESKYKIFTHDGKNFDKLRNMVGYEYLPSEYGGPSTNKLDVNVLVNHLLQHSEYLLKLQSYKRAL